MKNRGPWQFAEGCRPSAPFLLRVFWAGGLRHSTAHTLLFRDPLFIAFNYAAYNIQFAKSKVYASLGTLSACLTQQGSSHSKAARSLFFMHSPLSPRLPFASRLRLLALGLLAAWQINQPLQAATLTWDITSGDGATITGGSGTWTNGGGNWNTGAGNTTWSNGTPDSAIFGGTAGTVTLGGAVTVGNMTFNSGYTIAGGANTLTLSNSTITTNAAVSISTLAGSTGLIKAGTETLTLTGSNTFTGALTINEGTVRLLSTSFNALFNATWQTPSPVSIASGAVLTADQTVNNHHHIGTLTLNGGTLTSVNGPAGPANDGGWGNFALRTVTVGGSSMSTISSSTIYIVSGSFDVGDVVAGTDLLVSSSMATAPHQGALVKTGNGTMTLTGSGGTTTAATTISGGTLQIGNGGTTGSLSTSSAITNNATLSFNRSNTVTQGTDFASAISGSGSVIQAGSGTLVLNGTNTYSGTTTVSGGTLQVATGGSLTATTNVTVNTGGTLLLSGTGNQINNAATVTLAGGTIQTNGASSINETVGALTLSSTSTIDFGTLAGGNTLSFGDSSAAPWSGTLNVWNWTSGTDHLFFGSSSSGLTGTQLTQINLYSDSGSTFLSNGGISASGEISAISAVPEPSSVFVAASLLALIGWRERRWFLRCPEALKTGSR